MKQFTLSATFEGYDDPFPFDIYVGDGVPVLHTHPFWYQQDWLRRWRGGELFKEYGLSFARMLMVAREGKKKFVTVVEQNLDNINKDMNLDASRSAKDFEKEWLEIEKHNVGWIKNLKVQKPIKNQSVHLSKEIEVDVDALEKAIYDLILSVIPKQDNFLASFTATILKHMCIYWSEVIRSSERSCALKIYQNLISKYDSGGQEENCLETFAYNIAVFLDCEGARLPHETRAVLSDFYFMYESAQPFYDFARKSFKNWVKQPCKSKSKQVISIWKELNQLTKQNS